VSASVHPFTIYEAEVRLFAVGADGEIDTEEWLGGCAESLEIEGEYETLPVEIPGRPRPRIHHLAESWRVRMTNVRTIETGNTPRTVRIRRNQEYALVAIWWDEQERAWLKQCFLGVKGQPPALTADNIFQRLAFDAEEMIALAGSGARPEFDLIRNGEVWYVDAGGRTLFYRYDGAARVFTATADADPDEAEIIESGDDITITIGGAVALEATADGIETGEIVAEGGTLLTDLPRLEFWSGNTRTASLSVAHFVVPSLLESDAAPGASSTVDFYTPDWLFSLTSARAVAPEFNERTP
jgi:hypothetical protein